ncbi:hypothetical protein PLICRDRAFT_97799 [Plicaturopsis crispa FD-325 SS-3]|nr:hypothetical protein PLICRDRAFT_97799 [Plicaturopsis crispa FD-325 SS-3]
MAPTSIFHPKPKAKKADKGTSLLFHPKPKKAIPQSETRSPSPQKTVSAVTAQPKIEEDDSSKLPDGPYQEFRLMSSASMNGWKYDVMKFDSRKPVDVASWQGPVKLNRKEPRREESAAGPSAPEAVGPMLGPDGKPVVGSDGRVVMVDADGRPIHNAPAGGSGANGKDAKGKGGGGRKKFQKKTRQVFLVPEATRQLRREERYPWVMEDASQKEIWVGKLEDVGKSETHAFFMPENSDVFRFIPAHRWYKFQKKPNYHIPNLEEAEAMMAKFQKNKDPERWLLHHRNGVAPSASTTAMFKAETEGAPAPSGSSLAHTSSGPSLGPGGRRLRTVDDGMSGLFGDDDEDGDAKKRRAKEYGGEGDLDEQEYEEDFADDDEQAEPDNDDEEAKELEERLKREYKTANKTQEGYVDESESDEDESKLTKEGKAMKKLIRNLEKNNAYDSDEEKNPYASSDEEEEEEPIPPPEPAVQQPPSAPTSRPQTPSKTAQAVARPSGSGSRATSPAASGGGHSIVAKRATSPKIPSKPKVNGVSRGNSPLANGSPPGSRATSPVNAGTPKPSNKRKATDDPSGKAKKRTKAQVPPAGALEDHMVIDWLRNTPNASTRDCIQHFTPYLTDEAKKAKFTALVKEVAQLKGGVLVLRNAYRGSAAPSPAP